MRKPDGQDRGSSHERILLGDCVITNTGPRTRLQIEGHVSVLREKDIMTLSQADSLAKLIYLAIQFIYTANNPKEHHELYFRLSDQFLNVAPRTKADGREHQQPNLNRRHL